MTAYSFLILGLFCLTAIAGLASVRFSIFLSHKLDILDRPDPRKAHRAPVAYLGGLGILTAFTAGMLGFFLIAPQIAVAHREILTVTLGGAIAIFLVGFWDDVRPMPALLKLFLQVTVASAMWIAGIRIEMLSLMGGHSEQFGWMVSYIITVGWYTALMNAINLVDGLDGLAGGITLICAISLVGVGMVMAYDPNGLVGTVIGVLAAGSVAAFLRYNWHPARTFMGDGGSLLLGFLLATASLIGRTKSPTLLAMVVPLVALGLPLFETSFSFLRRMLDGKSPFKPDRLHLHHRLLDLGLDQRRVVLVLLFFTACLGVNSVVLAEAQSQLLLLNVLFLIGGLLLLIENLGYLQKNRPPSETAVPMVKAPVAPHDIPREVVGAAK